MVCVENLLEWQEKLIMEFVQEEITEDEQEIKDESTFPVEVASPHKSPLESPEKTAKEEYRNPRKRLRTDTGCEKE